jgi:hypothetical protein
MNMPPKKRPCLFPKNRQDRSLHQFFPEDLEIDFRVVIAALQKFFHLFLTRLARVGQRAGIQDRIRRNVMQPLEEDVFRHKALLGRIAVFSVMSVCSAGYSAYRSCREAE